jgi:hypothetical protein
VAVHTVTVSGGGGAAASSPTSTAAPAHRAASSRRCSSTRRWNRRNRRSGRPKGPGLAFMRPEGRPIRRMALRQSTAPWRTLGQAAGVGDGLEELDDPDELLLSPELFGVLDDSLFVLLLAAPSFWACGARLSLR